MSRRQIRRVAAEDHLLLLLDDLLLIGIGWANTANRLRRALSDKLICGVHKHANRAHGKLRGRNAFRFEGRKQAHRPTRSRNHHIGRRRAHRGSEGRPMIQKLVCDLVASKAAQSANGIQHERLWVFIGDDLQQRFAGRLVL